METVCFFLEVSNVLKRCSHVALHFETFTQICVNPISSRDISSQVVGWVGTSNNLLRNLCFYPPRWHYLPLYRSEPALESIDPAVWDNYPEALMKKDSLSCSCHLNPWHHFTFSSSRFAISFEGHSVYVHGRVSRFYDTPVWESRFYRSLCYVVCVHGLLSLE